MTLPATPTSRAGKPPQRARCILAGMPKCGKTTLAAAWAPDTTLIIDTHGGSQLLDGHHYVAHVKDWPAFVQVVSDLILTRHSFQTVVLDLAEDLWRMCDKHHAPRKGDRLLAPLASAANDYQRSIKTAEGLFRDTVGKLLTSPMGVWFITHVREKQEENVTIYAPQLDPRIYSWVHGACDFIFLAENAGSKRLLHTQPGVQFEAGSRVPMPEPLPLDARELWLAMDRGLNPHDYDEQGQRKRAEPTLDPIAPVVAEPPPAPSEQKDVQHAGESDVTAPDPWVDAIKDRASAFKGELRDALAGVGAAVPDRISSWSRVLAGLDWGQRKAFEAWLTEREERSAAVPWTEDEHAEASAAADAQLDLDEARAPA